MAMTSAISCAACWLGLAALAAGQCLGERVHSPMRWHRANFGASVQISGDVALVGDRSDHTFCGTSECFNGAVHAFRRIDGAWELEETIFHSRISGREGGLGDQFGSEISIDTAGRFAASAPGEDVVEPDTGAVYIFEHNGEAWREVAQILPVEPIWASGFGGTLALRGDTLVVGQERYNVAYLYIERNGRWEFAQKIEPPDPQLGARFGNALAMNDEWLMVGAWGDDEKGGGAGATYIFRRQAGGEFEFHRKLFAPGDPWNQGFGADVDIDGERMIVGAVNGTGPLTGEGTIYVYDFVEAAWKHVATLEPDTSGRARMGESVALFDDIVVGGAPYEDVPGVSFGAAYVFQRQPDGTWRQTAKVLPAIVGPGDFSFSFGHAIATDGASVIVGAPQEWVGGAPQTGAAHIFDLSCLVCRADLDGDGELTFFDFLAFQNLFAAGDLRADFDGDGELTFFDFLAFQAEFAAGCE